MDDELVRREQQSLRRLLGADLERVVQAVPEEPLLMPGYDLGDNNVPLVIAPHDFRDGEALADRVQQVVLHVLEALHAAELLLNEGSNFLVPRVVAERDNLEVQAGDGVFPSLKLTE